MEQLKAIIESPMFKNFIIGVIIFNAVILGLETSSVVINAAGSIISALDNICLAIFVVELLAKLAVYRHRFFTNGWNIFDFVIVGISLMPASEGLSVLRALRIMRVFACHFCRAQLEARGRRFLDRLAWYGVRVLVDGDHLLHRCCYGNQTVRHGVS